MSLGDKRSGCWVALLGTILMWQWSCAAETEDGTKQTPWGVIQPVEGHPGRFEFSIQRAQSGKLEFLPRQQVLQCETLEAPPRQVAIEVDPKTGTNTLLIPQLSKTPADEKSPQLLKFTAFVANETSQQSDGTWFLTAQSALIDGTHVKLESQPGNHRIGFWTDAADSVQWKFNATRWGMYRAKLVYSNASPAGSEVVVRVGEEELSAKLDSTGSWYRYTTMDLGQVYLPTAGEKIIEVRCKKLVGGAVMNLKAIILEPDFEGPLPVQAEDGSITLYCGSARINGTILRYEPAEHKRTIGFWTKKETATWRFQVKEPQKFEVEVWQGCGKGQGGSEVEIQLGEQKISFVVEETGHFQNFKARRVGKIIIDQSGEYELSVTPEHIAKAAACDIRQIRLLPIRGASKD